VNVPYLTAGSSERTALLTPKESAQRRGSSGGGGGDSSGGGPGRGDERLNRGASVHKAMLMAMLTRAGGNVLTMGGMLSEGSASASRSRTSRADGGGDASHATQSGPPTSDRVESGGAGARSAGGNGSWFVRNFSSRAHLDKKGDRGSFDDERGGPSPGQSVHRGVDWCGGVKTGYNSFPCI
jgi:hypothetical protein